MSLVYFILLLEFKLVVCHVHTHMHMYVVGVWGEGGVLKL